MKHSFSPPVLVGLMALAGILGAIAISYVPASRHSPAPSPSSLAATRVASAAPSPKENAQQDVPPLPQDQAPTPATPSAPAEAGKPDTQAIPSVPEGTDTKTAPPAAEKPRDPEAERLMASLAQAPDAKKERIFDRLLELRSLKRLSGEDALFAIAQLQEREKKGNAYSLLYMNMMAREYWDGDRLDKAIAVLQEGIDAIQSGKYQLGTYKTVRLTTEALKLAAIADIRKRISKYQDDIAGTRRKRPTYTGPPGATSICRRKYDSLEKEAAQMKAVSLRYERRRPEAEAAFLALGDRENAAAVLLGGSFEVGITDEKRHAVADEVIRKYPETVQAAHAMKQKAHLYAEAGDETNERAMLEALVARYPDTEPGTETQLDLGYAYEHRGEYDKAIGYLNTLYRKGIDKKKTVYPGAAWLLAKAYEKKQDKAAAKKVLEEAIACLDNPAFTMNEETEPDSPLTRPVTAEHFRGKLKELQP